MNRIIFERDGELRKRLQALSEAYFEGKSYKGNYRLYIKTIVGISAWIILYYNIVFANHANILSFFMCISMGFVLPFIGFTTMHDALHGAYSNKKWVNNLMGYSLELMGPFGILWVKKHSGMHHSRVNIHGQDDDIEAGPFIRSSPNQKWKKIHKFQQIYAPILYSLLYIYWVWVTDFKKYFSKKILNESIILRPIDHVVFWVEKILHIFVMVVVPLQFYSLPEFLIGYFAMALVCGTVLSHIFQPAHVTGDNEFLVPDENNRISISQTELQFISTSNFATKNKILSWYAGGLNFQIEHHLFHQVSHVHYPALQAGVIKICKDFDIEYVEYKNLWAAFCAHYKHLKKMGETPKTDST